VVVNGIAAPEASPNEVREGEAIQSHVTLLTGVHPNKDPIDPAGTQRSRLDPVNRRHGQELLHGYAVAANQ
jgi:hypothetical protein